MQPTPRPLAGLVVTDDALPVEAWHRLGFEGKVALLAALTPAQLRAQASVLAVAGQRSVVEVVSAWHYSGYLPYDRAVSALAPVAPAPDGEAVQL